MADRIQKALAKAIEVDGHELFVTASIGVALRSERYQRPEQVLRDADIAMYQAKLEGEGLLRALRRGDARRASWTGSSSRPTCAARWSTASEFLLHYQPIVALRTGKLIGLEALVRWNKPGRGLLVAAEFIALAEESGVVVPIGEWVIRDRLRAAPRSGRSGSRRSRG